MQTARTLSRRDVFGCTGSVGRGSGRLKAFTLIELLVVIAIIALLVSILLPSLRTARQLAMAAMCSSNLHSIYGAGAMYSADNSGWTGPQYEVYWPSGTKVSPNLYYPLFGPPWSAVRPAIFDTFGQPYGPVPPGYPFNTPEFSMLDHYYVLGLVTGTVDYGMRRSNGGSPKHVICEVEVAICPLASTTFSAIAGCYGGPYGRVRGTYGHSALIMSYPYPRKITGRDFGQYRNNAYGPYKPEELIDTSKTIWMCDGMAMTDVGGGMGLIPCDPTTGNPTGPERACDVAFVRDLRFHHIAGPGTQNPWRMFGQISFYIDEENINKTYVEWEYYHVNPAAAHWDGHVSNYSPPGDGNISMLRKHLSKDGTDNDW